MSKCADCGTDLDHCHGTLLLHRDGTLDCTDDACDDLEPLRHGLVVDCAAVAAGCCAEPAEHELAQAS
ncbi:MAG: hypothetical protein ICV70_02775 [Jiangellaceae bacterium]|nr:hypothetical protein [Jiangellaceae bacterium]